MRSAFKKHFGKIVYILGATEAEHSQLMLFPARRGLSKRNHLIQQWQVKTANHTGPHVKKTGQSHVRKPQLLRSD